MLRFTSAFRIVASRVEKAVHQRPGRWAPAWICLRALIAQAPPPPRASFGGVAVSASDRSSESEPPEVPLTSRRPARPPHRHRFSPAAAPGLLVTITGALEAPGRRGLLLPDTRMAAAVGVSLALMLAMERGFGRLRIPNGRSHRLCWRSAIEVVSAAAVTVAVGSS